MAKTDLTAQRLRELFAYDPETGEFVRIARGRGARVGRRLGSIGKDGYSLIYVAGRNYPAQRLAWLYVHGAWPSGDIDHINGDRTDNRIANLREATRAVNMQNLKRARADNKSGLLGVSRVPNRPSPWKASIMANKVCYDLGRYRTPEEAHAAYLAAKRRLHDGCTI